MTVDIRLARVVGAGLLTVAASVAWGAAPHLVRDINMKPIAISSMPTDFADFGSVSFFDASDGVHGHEPWSTDGTSQGTFRWGDVTPGLAGAVQRRALRVGASLYLIQNEGSGGVSVWVSGGTPQSTQRITTDELTTNAQNADGLGALGSRLAFTVFGASGTRELWVCDGTAAGTGRVQAASGDRYSLASSIIVGSKVYFLSLAVDGTVEPWVSDGTTGNTRRLAQIPDAAPQHITVSRMIRSGNYIVFAATTAGDGSELWRIDSRDDSVAFVEDIVPGPGSSLYANEFEAVGDVAVFRVMPGGDPSQRFTLWRTDGTAAGTFEISAASVLPFSFYDLESAGVGRFLFRVDAGGAVQLWGTDASIAGTQQLRNTDAFSVSAVGNRYYFFDGTETQLWATDGTAVGTTLINGIGAAGERYLSVAGTSDQLYVRTVGSANSAGHIYKRDLASSATTTLIAYAPESPLSLSAVFDYAQGRLYFDNFQPDTGRELWISDGTVAGTRMLQNLALETQTFPSSPDGLTRFAGKLFFAADDGDRGRELWMSDGSEVGTELLIDLNPGAAGSSPSDLFVFKDALYFYAVDGTGVSRLWQSDGTAAGTRAIAEIKARPGSIRAVGCDSKGVSLGSVALFAGFDDAFGLQLWKTDGTTAGTSRITNLSPFSFGGAGLCYLTAAGNRVYFQANHTGGSQLWSSDGSAAGTVQLTTLPVPGLTARPMVELSGILYFIAADSDGAPGDRLWTSDGSPSGTRMAAMDLGGGAPVALAGVLNNRMLSTVRDTGTLATFPQPWAITPAAASLLSTDARVFSGPLFVHRRLAFFSARYAKSNGAVDLEPWVTDGTPEGTRLLLDTVPGFSQPRNFTDFDGAVLFETTGPDELILWRTNGTAESTKQVGALTLGNERAAASNHLFFVSNDGTTGAELYAIENERPIASNDTSASVQAGGTVTFNVLANDRDNDGSLDAATLILESAPTGGTVSIGSNGDMTYAARANFSGTDTFTYSVKDDQAFTSAPATVQIGVTVPSPPPPSGGSGGNSGGGGGGGSQLPLDLTLLLLAVVLRWRRTLTANHLDTQIFSRRTGSLVRGNRQRPARPYEMTGIATRIQQ